MIKKEDTLQIDIIHQGEGDSIKNGQVAVVHYTGSLTDGTVFDSSVERETPLSFKLGAGDVIAGWDQGVEGMKVGERRRLTIPAHLAYGSAGAGGVIPPHATLIFEVELIEKH
jgi:peptidylprolyl isomerase